MAGEILTPPAHRWAPPAAKSMAPLVADVLSLVGRSLDPEQHLAVETLTGADPGGRWTTLESAINSPRQNIKTYICQGIALTALFVLSTRLITWSAHEFDTTMDSFRDIEMMIEGCSDLSRYVRRVSHENGNESVELTNRCRLKFKARTKTGGRGLSAPLLILDEAFALRAAHMGTLLPLVSAQANPKVIYGSSAPMATSEILHELVRRGRSGNDPSLSYIEWSAPRGGCQRGEDCTHERTEPGCAADEPSMWQAANLAMRRGRIRTATIAAERRSLPAGEFVREILGWEDEPEDAAAAPITVHAWVDVADPTAGKPSGRPVWAVDVSPSRATAAIGVAARREDGMVHVGLVEHGAGTEWVVERLAAAAAKAGAWDVWLDPASPALTLVPALTAAGLVVHQTSSRDLGAWCGQLQDAVLDRPATLVHSGDPIVTAAVSSARRRDIGDGLWAWGRRRSDGDITSLVAITQAFGGLLAGVDPLSNIW